MSLLSKSNKLDPETFTTSVSVDCLRKMARFLGFQLKQDQSEDILDCFLYPRWILTKKIPPTASRFLVQEDQEVILAKPKSRDPKELLEAVVSTPSFSWKTYDSCYGVHLEHKTNPFFNVSTLEELEAKLDFLERTASRFQLQNV